MNKDKNFLLNESKVFCMLPWIHVHTTPFGKIGPCCIGSSCFSNKNSDTVDKRSLMETVNVDHLNQLRSDMLNEVVNDECKSCLTQEEHGVESFRISSNKEYKKYIDAVDYTNDDGSLSQFKMRYFDMRFNNICNFKCRTCSQEYSSKWEQENKSNDVIYYTPHPKNDTELLVNDIKGQFDNLETAYFAGGEPLIMEEHYILLEEMIRTGNTDIQLRYSTNFSNLNFKDKDILKLWSHFSKVVDVYVSLDHVGDKAEYIRTGTEWEVVEENFKMALQQPYMVMHINTVLSMFNYLTIDKFYEYLIKNSLFNKRDDNKFFVYLMDGPTHFSCRSLPVEFRNLGIESVNRAVKIMNDNKIPSVCSDRLLASTQWVQGSDISMWDMQKEKFKSEIVRLDKIRNNSFTDTFPELAQLMDL